MCDNIDLVTVLQEYESFHFVKFKKHPKLVKKIVGGSGKHRAVITADNVVCYYI